MADTTVTFAVVQSNKQQLCVLPSTWLYPGKWFKAGKTDNKIKTAGTDKGFWPKTSSAIKDFNRAKNGELIYPTAENSEPFRCKIRRCDIETVTQVTINLSLLIP